MYSEVFTSRLKKAREYNGITQQEVAKALKISRSTYAGYESGRTEPNIELIAMLSKLFCVSTDWLVGVSSESNINSITQILEERNREKILRKMEKEAELARRVWG